MANENAVRNLIRIEDKSNPTLFRALQLMIDDLYTINNKVFPPKTIAGVDQGGIVKPLGPVQNFTGVAYPDNLRLDWDDLDGAFRYHIKMGNDWDTARHILLTATDMANVDPVYLNLVYGTYQFLIRAMNLESELGDSSAATLIIPTIPPPELAVEVVVSTVLLRWTVPASAWRIDHYIIYKDNVAVGAINGTFKLIQEQVGGSYGYSVEAVDIVGNVSTRSATQVVDLHDPSEFEFVDELQADYIGIYDHTALINLDGLAGVLGPIWPDKTWEQHYVDFGFISPQDQVDKGYPLYWQPAYNGEGSYEETFDFGQIYEELTIVVDYNKQQLYGSTNISTEIQYSTDGTNWSAIVIGNSVLATFRYVHVKWIFTNIDDLSAAFISNLKVVLNVTLTIDSGSVDCLASDYQGTLVTYNKVFTGISSVTATAATSLQPLYAVCDYITKDNFRILVFDSSGNRINSTIDWKARGVI